jgi:AraC-like DNA-binding protein
MTVVRTHYREFRPPPALAARLVCLWASNAEGPRPAYEQRVLPDGCVDIVWIGDLEPTVAGPATRHVHVPIPIGVDVVGLRFGPGQAEAMLGLPAEELLNSDVRLADIWGSAAARFGDPIREARSMREKLALLEGGSLRHFTERPQSDATVAAGVAWLSRHPDGLISQLQEVCDLSSRQLQRRFRSAVGYGPKTFHRILRLQRLLHLVARNAVHGLAALSAATGYADQAHMSREVRDLAGQSPSSLLVGGGSTLSMSDLFKTDSS